jgi:hypothetical protein
VGSIACSLASGACVSDHECSFNVPSCDQTLITLQSPKNAWTPGVYKLTLNNGTANECTLSISAPPPAGSLDGTCSSADTRFTLTQLCLPPPMVCNSTACSVMEPNTNCLPGQFQIDITSPLHPGPVGLDLEVDDRTLMNETITPKAVTTEPNGEGCGMCTNASVTVSISGG